MQRTRKATTWITSVGVGSLVAGIFADGKFSDADMRALGLAGVLCGAAVVSCTWLAERMMTIALQHRPDEKAIWDHGRKFGHAEGYREGRAVARPVLIDLTDLTDPAAREDTG